MGSASGCRGNVAVPWAADIMDPLPLPLRLLAAYIRHETRGQLPKRTAFILTRYTYVCLAVQPAIYGSLLYSVCLQ